MEIPKYCPECCSETIHGTCYLNPDDEESPLIWVCSVCGNSNEVVSTNEN